MPNDKSNSGSFKPGMTPWNKGKHYPNHARGYHLSEETKAKISIHRSGIQHTEEAKTKISNAGKGRLRSPYWDYLLERLGHRPLPECSYIYAIIRQSDIATIWVGQTKAPIGRWQRGHRATKGEGDTAFILLEEVLDVNRHTAEQYWIATLRSWGEPLKNKAIGGPSSTGYQHTDQDLAKYLASRTYEPRSAETKEKISEALKRYNQEKVKAS